MGMDISSGPKRAVRPAMNVAPLVDVVLVLLIIFMVITPMLTKQATFNVPPKVEDNEPPPPPSDNDEPQVILWVGKDGKAHVNKETVDDAQLAQHLKSVFAARSSDGQVLFFDAVDDVDFGRALTVLDIARGAEIRRIVVLPEAVEGLE